jgi:hypothetical protein
MVTESPALRQTSAESQPGRRGEDPILKLMLLNRSDVIDDERVGYQGRRSLGRQQFNDRVAKRLNFMDPDAAVRALRVQSQAPPAVAIG